MNTLDVIFFVEVLKLFKQGIILLKCIHFNVIILIFGNKCKMANVSIIANLFCAQINLKKKENSLSHISQKCWFKVHGTLKS